MKFNRGGTRGMSIKRGEIALLMTPLEKTATLLEPHSKSNTSPAFMRVESGSRVILIHLLNLTFYSLEEKEDQTTKIKSPLLHPYQKRPPHPSPSTEKLSNTLRVCSTVTSSVRRRLLFLSVTRNATCHILRRRLFFPLHPSDSLLLSSAGDYFSPSSLLTVVVFR
ncbi:hypothetical protein CEXT_461391 [Caerostris extrusa]|uniref:Uncharacterized protein n=1 Tax=Caerostris extrusa TaxID=172846 RepID=A0AAV4XP99_CAEEX|nr:hypothetical protein CEXT_461391 [Caerostris extrusa]